MALKFSWCVLGIPNDAYITFNQNLIGCPILSPEYSKLISQFGGNSEHSTYPIKMVNFFSSCAARPYWLRRRIWMSSFLQTWRLQPDMPG